MSTDYVHNHFAAQAFLRGLATWRIQTIHKTSRRPSLVSKFAVAEKLTPESPSRSEKRGSPPMFRG